MADFTRSVVWRFWTALLLLGDMLVHLVRAATIEDQSSYQACLESPSTCTSLDIRDNQLSGTIPTEMGLLTSMTRLRLEFNELSGTIPTEMGLMTSMRHLDLFGNQLSGNIPTEMGLMTSMTHIDLRDNQLSGNIPTEMGLMTSMTHINLRDNELSGTIPTEMGLMTSMRLLYVYGNAGLCGDLVSIGSVGTSYNCLDSSPGCGISGTNLGLPCPPSKPCCDELRLNPVFCCIEARRPEFALSVCEEC